jgi:hypothetical protein
LRQITKAASKAGQLSAGPSLDAKASMETETPILPNSHNMKLTAETLGDRLESRLVIPRAIKALGTTAQAAPYSADHPIS